MDGKAARKALMQACEHMPASDYGFEEMPAAVALLAQAHGAGLLAIAKAIESHAAAVRSATEAVGRLIDRHIAGDYADECARSFCSCEPECGRKDGQP